MNKLFWSFLSMGSVSVAAISFCGGYGLFSPKEKRNTNAPFISPPPPNLKQEPTHKPPEHLLKP